MSRNSLRGVSTDSSRSSQEFVAAGSPICSAHSFTNGSSRTALRPTASFPSISTTASRSLWKRRPSDNTLKNYIEYLEGAFLFGEARRFEVKGRRYLDSPVKYYAADLGLRNARLNFRDTDRSHPMENLIYNDLLRRGYNVDVSVVPISSRQERQAVDSPARDRLHRQSRQRQDLHPVRASPRQQAEGRAEDEVAPPHGRLLQEDRHHGRLRRTALRRRRHLPRRHHPVPPQREFPRKALSLLTASRR